MSGRRSWFGRSRVKRGWILWCGGLLVVGLLIVVVIGSFRHAVSTQRSGDPRSMTAQGTKALGQLLEDEGVRTQVIDSVAEAVASSDPSTLLVVASPDRLTDEQAAQLGRATYGRLLLFGPGRDGLRAFGVPAETTVPAVGPVDPGCTEQAATMAGTIDTSDVRTGYTSEAGAVTVSCYPGGKGAAWLRVGGPFGPVDLVAGGVSNEVLNRQGNAAFGMNVFGAYPRVVWLMGQRAAAATDSGPQGPGLLPTWWAPTIVQAFVALIVVGLWRGRRLGPILREPLPVTVRAAETVEGHGRMYARIGARDRAADALRAGVCRRLGQAYGVVVADRRFGTLGAERRSALLGVERRSALLGVERRSAPARMSGVPSEEEIIALSAAIAARTGRAAPEIRRLLAGPPPASDDDLVTLAQQLDRLEQEARQL